MKSLIALATLTVLIASCRHSGTGFTQRDLRAAASVPGMMDDGSVLLPNQWRLRPAGKQIAVGDFPVNIALHPSGAFAAVLHCGYGQHEIIVIDVKAEKIQSRAALNESFYGLAFAGDGKTLYASGASDEVVHRFAF